MSVQTEAPLPSALSEHARRISYFMLVRLVMFIGLTALASLVTYTRGADFSAHHVTLLWAVVGVGFGLTVVFARMLPRTQDLDRFAAVQTSSDLVFSAVAVYLSGGIDSGLVTLYLIAVLGAAIMGSARLTWTAAAAATLLYSGSATLEITGALVPMTIDGYVPLGPRALGFNMLRTIGGVAGVAVLSSYLNRQLTTSVSALGTLRLLNENIVRSISSGLLTVDMHGRVLYFNPVARRILDLEDHDIGKPLESLLPGCRLEDESGDGVDTRQELVVATRGGRAVRVGLSLAPLTDPSDAWLGHVVNFQDLTRLHELAQQVRRNDRLAALGGMAASVAHEIRNPLAAITGSAELLTTAELSDEEDKLLAIIRRESGRLSALITDLLSFTRPRPPQRRRTQVDQAIGEAVEAFRTDPACAGLELVQRIADRCEANVDPAQLTQVLWNLLRNAGQALDGQGTIELSTHQEDDMVRVDVVDDGPGIAPDDLEKIFDPFFTTKDSGTGFGLAIVHRVVEENGGTIVCETSSAGTRFTLRLPPYTPDTRPDDSGVLELGDSTPSRRAR